MMQQHFRGSRKNPYLRYCYWLEAGEFNALSQALGDEHPIYHARQVICEPLRRDVQIGCAFPEVWDVLCRRQSSWYKASPKANKILLVSTFDLEEYGLQPETLIFDSKFRPSQLPGLADQEELVNLQRYKSLQPLPWVQISEEDKRRIIEHARAMGIRDPYEQVLLSRSANHANFLEPRYYVRQEDEILPYSIGKSGNVCSSCLEFFNIIGSEFRTKLVVPCAGAVIYAGMRVNRYYEVKSLTTYDSLAAGRESLHS